MMHYYCVACFVVAVVCVGTVQNVDRGYFWHVTDFHYDHTYLDEQLSCNAEVPNPGHFGDYWCDSPWSLVENAITNMDAIRTSGVDFIVWTGDTVAHIKDKDTSLSKNLEILHNATTAFKNTFPSIPVFASLGNHDFFPSDQASDVESEIYRKVSAMWENWIMETAEVDVFRRGGYYKKQVQDKLVLLALNTNLYYTKNKLTPNISDPAGQFEWMEQELSQARAGGKKVIVTAHIPPGLLTPGFVDWFHPAHKSKFEDILLNYSDVIVASHYGHDHSDGFKILQDEGGTKAVPQYIAPSVTPWRFKIPNLSGKAHNPGIRLVEYDRVTGAHLDYVQYYINLTDSNNNGQTDWKKLYRFTDAYDVSDMSVTSLRKLFSRIEDGKGKKYTTKYCNYALVSSYDKECTDTMRGEIYCGGLISNMTSAKTCVDSYLKGLGDNGASRGYSVGICGALLSIVISFTRYV